MRTILDLVNTAAAKAIVVSERKATGVLFLAYAATFMCVSCVPVLIIH